MKPQIMENASIRLIGYEYVPKRDETFDYHKDGAYWSNIDFKDYADYHNQSAHRGEIGVWINPNESSRELSYFYGVISNNNEEMPEGFKELILPASKYAAFTVEWPSPFSTEQLAEDVRKVWQYIFTDGLESKETAFDDQKPCFEFYRGETTLIFIPIK